MIAADLVSRDRSEAAVLNESAHVGATGARTATLPPTLELRTTGCQARHRALPAGTRVALSSHEERKMQAFVCTAYGPPSVLQLREVPTPVSFVWNVSDPSAIFVAGAGYTLAD